MPPMDRVVGAFRHLCSLCVKRFKRQDTGRTETIQFSKICDLSDSLAISVNNRLATNLAGGGRVSGFEVLMNRDPICSKQAPLPRIASRNFSQTVASRMTMTRRDRPSALPRSVRQPLSSEPVYPIARPCAG